MLVVGLGVLVWVLGRDGDVVRVHVVMIVFVLLFIQDLGL